MPPVNYLTTKFKETRLSNVGGKMPALIYGSLAHPRKKIKRKTVAPLAFKRGFDILLRGRQAEQKQGKQHSI